MTEKSKSENGVTLIALVFAIIILIKVIDVTIAALTGDNGLLKTSANAKITTEIEGYQETIQLSAQIVDMYGTFLDDDNYENELEIEMGKYDNIKDAKAEKIKKNGDIIVQVVTKDNYVFWITDDSVEYKGTTKDIQE